MKISRNYKLIFYALIFYFLVFLSHRFGFLINDYILHIINVSLIYVILTVSLNLINGFTGQFSIGHMGFAAVGAYISGILTTLIWKIKPTNLSNYILFIIAMLIGGLCAMGIGYLLGLPTLRLRGDYLAIVTLGFGEIIRTIINNIDYVGGPRGLLGIPKFSNFTFIFFITLISVIIMRNIVYSTHGRAFKSIREDPIASELVGVNTTKYKVMVFTIASFFAGIAGSLLCHLLQIAHPTQYGFMGTILVLVMVYAGGMGSISGSIIAAFGLTFMSEGLRLVLRKLDDITPTVQIGIEWRMVVYALLLILIMLFRTEGLMGKREIRILVPEEEEK
jgi:branched-chain amino acid transport system permease protein